MHHNSDVIALVVFRLKRLQRPVTNTVLPSAFVGYRCWYWSRGIILSIKNLLPDLHIVLISYLSLALNETQNRCLRVLPLQLESECFSVKKCKITVEINENTNRFFDSISGHGESSEGKTFMKDKCISFWRCMKSSLDVASFWHDCMHLNVGKIMSSRDRQRLYLF